MRNAYVEYLWYGGVLVWGDASPWLELCSRYAGKEGKAKDERGEGIVRLKGLNTVRKFAWF